MLLGELGRGVDVARVGRGVLGDQAGDEWGAAARTGRFEAARLQVCRGPRPGAYDAVLRAVVAALSVHHHRPGQHQPPYARLGHRGEQDRGAQVVAGDVLGRVRDAVAEAHHGRLVTDRVHAGQGAGDRRVVAHVGARIGPDVVHERLVSARPQRLDDMGPDETGTAGDQYSHTATLDAHGAATGRRGHRVMAP